MMDKKAFIQNEFSKIKINLTENQAMQFEQYYEMLVKKNEVMNLTAITDFEEVVQKHFIDSVMIKELREPKAGEKWIDVGTGAGFPGLPLKIVYPDLKITLLDSLNKRVKFLQEAADFLELKDVEALHGRAEEYAKKGEYREQYDCCVSRAVANLASLSEYCLPFVKVGGCFVPYKSGKILEEIEQAGKAVEILGGKISTKKEFHLPESDMYRCLLYIEKVKNTAKKYPRKAGTPTKEPLH